MRIAQEFLENLWKNNAEYAAILEDERQRIKRRHDSKIGEILCGSLKTNDNKKDTGQ